MRTIVVYGAAAVAEIAGCFAFWAWARNGASPLWLLAGLGALAAFAGLLTLAETATAGRAYAAYSGIYIATSLVWLWLVEGFRPDRWDVLGASIAIIGAGVILFGPRG